MGETVIVSRELLQQLLDNAERSLTIIQNLRAALAQEEQEPVAWMVYTEDGKSAYVTDNPHDLVGAYKAFALYTHPPRREWQGLTDADYDLICDNHSTLQGAVRAIEAKLKEKNNA